MNSDDGAFVADAEIDSALRNRGSSKSNPRVSVESAAGRHSGDIAKTNSSEDTPLLTSADEEERSIGDGEGNEEEDPFALLPWWKRPSVLSLPKVVSIDAHAYWLFLLDILGTPNLSSRDVGVRRCLDPSAKPDIGTDMPQLHLREDIDGPQFYNGTRCLWRRKPTV
jgi:hypothetical protein